MHLLVADTLNISFENAPGGMTKFLQRHIPDLIQENDTSGADITIRFVDSLGSHADLKIAPFAERWKDNFLYVDKYDNKAIIPIDILPTHAPIVILAERNIVPALFYETIIRMVIRYRLLQRNISFIHASGIAVNGQGIIFPAWGGTGKTNMVIQFLQDGASYLGDDLVLTSTDGTLYAFPETISMFDYNFRTFPEYKQLLGIKKRSLFFLKQAMEWIDDVAAKTLAQDSLLRATIARMAILSKSFTTVSMSCSQLAPSCGVVSSIPLAKAVFLTKAEIAKPEVIIESPESLASRMAACLDFEHLFQMRLVDAFSFAFPEKKANPLRTAYLQEQTILKQAFSKAQIFHLRIPRNMESKELYAFTRNTLNV